MFKRLRILVLLLVLLFVALNAYFDRVYSTDWDVPLRVTIFPINGDGSAVTQTYIGSIGASHDAAIEAFFEGQAAHYELKLERPIRFVRGAQINELPPMIAPRTGVLGTMWWSLRSRFWAWRVAEHAGPDPDVELFVLYYDPQTSPALPHSIGLQKGLFGIVNAFASGEMEGSNDVVIAHELLHTLGAIDKYAFDSNQPLHPVGYAEPDREPLYPQLKAELMGGRIPLSPTESRIPRSLREVVVGPLTAREIGWTQ